MVAYCLIIRRLLKSKNAISGIGTNKADKTNTHNRQQHIASFLREGCGYQVKVYVF